MHGWVHVYKIIQTKYARPCMAYDTLQSSAPQQTAVSLAVFSTAASSLTKRCTNSKCSWTSQVALMVCHGGAWLDCTWCTDIPHVPVTAETGMLECLTYVNHLWVSMNQLSRQVSTTNSNEPGKENSQSRALRISSWKTQFPFPGIVWTPLWHCILDVLGCKFHPLYKATNQPTNQPTS